MVFPISSAAGARRRRMARLGSSLGQGLNPRLGLFDHGRRTGIHQLDGLGHGLGDFRVGGEPGQLLLPQIQVPLGQVFQTRRIRHIS